MEAELVLASSSKPIDKETATRAEEFYQLSIADAKKRGARSFELRTVLRLLDLVRGTDREREVLSQLRELYSSFTEGFDVPLLQRAAVALKE
jgi:hypothetical protein